MPARAMSSPWPGVRLLRHVAVPTRDGTILRADVYLPDRDDGPWPTVVEYLPYRKDDLTAARWNVPVALAQHGIAVVRLDVRGTGSSEGLATDEYSEAELLDGIDALHWFARQPWCDGRLGLWGTSYGAFNALQIAMQRPAPLVGVVAHAGSDDRYATDVHYWGGCLQALELLSYPLWMLAMNALPPDPETPGIAWADQWRLRLERGEPWLLAWLRHQRRDAYWLRGSVAHDYGAIACPVFVVGAWHDGYTDAAWRLLEHLAAPRRGLIGPWTHQRPDASPVGPRIDFLRELLAWWRSCFAGRSDAEPSVRIFLQDAHRPDRFPASIPGRWYLCRQWPPPGIRERRWYATADRSLAPEPRPDSAELAFLNDVRIGLAGPTWCPTNPPDSLADDQRCDDLFALTFDSEPLPEPLAILGAPVVRVVTAASARVAFLCVRLSHVWPDGAVTLVTRGALALTRRHGLDRCDPLVPGEWVEIEVPLKVCSYRLPAGHRLRLALSGADFPTIWPAPFRAPQRVRVGGRALELRLPTLTGTAGFAPVELAPPSPLPTTADTWSAAPVLELFTEHLGRRVGVRRTVEETVRPLGRTVIAHERTRTELVADLDEPARCRADGEQYYRLEWPVGTAEVAASLSIHSTATAFHVAIEVEASWNGRRVAQRRWVESVERDGL
ncbi:MAG: CocE/NonD family hydrolase [Thermomicrobium sp.]|nr:CocE/NonD family hydrolase [Thermomicrobium sp.]